MPQKPTDPNECNDDNNKAITSQPQNGVSKTNDPDDNKYARKPSKGDAEKQTQSTSPWVYMAFVSFAVITYVTKPNPLQPHHGEEPTIQHVFYYGWLTAISTGLGALPLVFAPKLADYWIGISNGKFLSEKKLIW